MNRLLRSTSVPIALRCNPMSRSPSQWPGTARSATSGGRWLINVSGVTWAHAFCRARARGTRNCPAPAQAGDEIPLECTAALNVERLVDGIVADPHGLIIGEIEGDPSGDLLRTPCRHSGPITAVGLVACFPLRCGARPQPGRQHHEPHRRACPGRTGAACRC